MAWIEVRSPPTAKRRRGKLLFEYDLERDVIRDIVDGEAVTIDVSELRRRAKAQQALRRLTEQVGPLLKETPRDP